MNASIAKVMLGGRSECVPWTPGRTCPGARFARGADAPFPRKWGWNATHACRRGTASALRAGLYSRAVRTVLGWAQRTGPRPFGHSFGMPGEWTARSVECAPSRERREKCAMDSGSALARPRRGESNFFEDLSES